MATNSNITATGSKDQVEQAERCIIVPTLPHKSANKNEISPNALINGGSGHTVNYNRDCIINNNYGSQATNNADTTSERCIIAPTLPHKSANKNEISPNALINGGSGHTVNYNRDCIINNNYGSQATNNADTSAPK